jgi:outer membrane protein assembly factor BamB
MTIYSRVALTAIFALSLAGCTSGSSSPTCSFNDAARFVPTPQPTPQGTPGSTVSNVTVSLNAQIQTMFPPAGALPKGAFVASPVLNAGEAAIYIGSTDKTMYKLNTADLSQDTTFNLVASDVITSTAIAALRDGQDAIFFGAGNGFLYAATETGSPQASYWPFGLGGFVSASPTMSLYDSTVYVGAQNGLLSGVCPNGIVRFSGSTTSIESSAAIGPDNTVYVGSDDRQLRALQNDGPLKWAFAASAPIVTAPVVEVQGSNTFVYTADIGGRVFKLNALSGLPVSGFTFQPVGSISSSPALGIDRLYFGSDDGNLYAISTTDGSRQWSVQTGGPIVSSPAVAIATDDLGNPVEVIVVVGSKDGNLYFVDDAAPQTPGVVPLKPGIRAGEPIEPIESSPAIGTDGTVYIGTDGGRVYAIR